MQRGLKMMMSVGLRRTQHCREMMPDDEKLMQDGLKMETGAEKMMQHGCEMISSGHQKTQYTHDREMMRPSDP